MSAPPIHASARTLGTNFDTFGGIPQAAGKIVRTVGRFQMGGTSRDKADDEITSCRNDHRVVPGTSNPPGSLDSIGNEIGRPVCCSLMPEGHDDLVRISNCELLFIFSS